MGQAYQVPTGVEKPGGYRDLWTHQNRGFIRRSHPHIYGIAGPEDVITGDNYPRLYLGIKPNGRASGMYSQPITQGHELAPGVGGGVKGKRRGKDVPSFVKVYPGIPEVADVVINHRLEVPGEPGLKDYRADHPVAHATGISCFMLRAADVAPPVSRRVSSAARS